MVRFLENIQKELLSAAHYATMDNKRIVPPAFSPTFAPPHPYFSQLLFNNSYMNRYPPPPPPPPPLMRFGNTPSDRPFSFHLPTQKRRRTKVILLLFLSLSNTFLFSEKKRLPTHVYLHVLQPKSFLMKIWQTMKRAYPIIRTIRIHPIIIITIILNHHNNSQRSNTMLFK